MNQSTQEETAHWYCLQSQPKHEFLAAECLTKHLSVEVFLPKVRFKKLVRLKAKWVTEPLFPRYMFVRCDDHLLPQVRSEHGVGGLVKFGGAYCKVQEELITQLKAYAIDQETIEVAHNMKAGDQVIVTEGPFQGLDALVKEILPAKERVRILIDMLGRQIEMKIETTKLLRKADHPLANQ
ncbi:MAG: transcription termination/antitermination NusG family protein [Verrucomicrobiota bacterium]